MTEAGLRKIFRTHRARTGAVRVRPHRLRHTFGTDLAAAGIDVLVLRESDGPRPCRDDHRVRALGAGRDRGRVGPSQGGQPVTARSPRSKPSQRRAAMCSPTTTRSSTRSRSTRPNGHSADDRGPPVPRTSRRPATLARRAADTGAAGRSSPAQGVALADVADHRPSSPTLTSNCCWPSRAASISGSGGPWPTRPTSPRRPRRAAGLGWSPNWTRQVLRHTAPVLCLWLDKPLVER